MALTKSRTSLNSGTTMTAGAGDVTSAAQDLTGSYATVVDIKITNGATGPTVAAQVQIQIGADSGGTLMCNLGGPLVGSVANSAVTSWSVELPSAAGCFKIVSGSNTAQNTTLDCDYSRITGI
jgi:ribosomal protein S28E/S33